MPKLSADQIRRVISDNAKLIHEHELTLARYENRKCKNPDRTRRAIADLKIDNRDLRDRLSDAIEAERKFMKSR